MSVLSKNTEAITNWKYLPREGTFDVFQDGNSRVMILGTDITFMFSDVDLY